jgi:hypothetical protein
MVSVVPTHRRQPSHWLVERFRCNADYRCLCRSREHSPLLKRLLCALVEHDNVTWRMRTQASLLIYPPSRQQSCHICACFVMLEIIAISQLDWPWGASPLLSRQSEKSTRSLYRIDRECNRDSVRRSAAFSCKATAHCIVSPQNVFRCTSH